MYSADKNETKQSNPLQELFAGIKRIIDFTEFKDKELADKYETTEIHDEAHMWMNALLGQDNYTTYSRYWDFGMFQSVTINVRVNNVRSWMEHPHNVPVIYRDALLEKGRAAFLNQYVERNDYYRKLMGLPPMGTDPSEYVYLTEPMRNQLHATNVPVHELSDLIQNNYMVTDEYKRLLEEHPDKEYLRYIGMNKIDPFVARNAKDFEIIRYPNSRADINPNLLKEFAAVYDSYREYVMSTLYNSQLNGLYPGYRTYMRSIIQMSTLMQICNRAVEAVTTNNFLDDSVLHIILSMYGIPDDLLMTNDVRRRLVINMLKLVREKGTDDVYYDLVNVLGYQDIIISRLMLMKGQQFDGDTMKTLTTDGEQMTSPDDQYPNVDPYFLQLDIKDKNPYDTIVNGNAPRHDYHKITDPDPTWWDLQDTKDILEKSYYTSADTKYIMIEAVIYQMKYMFESIFFMRMILDNKDYTEDFYIEVPELFGTEKMSVYDLMVYVLAATCMTNHLKGNISPGLDGPFATAGFNFDMDLDSFEEYLATTKHVDKDRLMSYMDNLTMSTMADIDRLFNDVMIPMREWLESMIAGASTREEYLEYENIYRAMFTYDVERNMFLNDYRVPIEVIKDRYNVSDHDMLALQHFYPRTLTGEAVRIETYDQSRYKFPFLTRRNVLDYWIHVTIDTPRGTDDRGYVYFHDILNCPDLRELTNPDGTRPFMDYNDGDIGWEVNQQAVNKALELIDDLDEKQLSGAYFQIETPILNSGGERFMEGEKLPASIRAGAFKSILHDKIEMDLQGLAVPPTTYFEYLERRNPTLYDLLMNGNRFETDNAAWLDDVLKVVLSIEGELSVHMKYFEQSVVGSEMFFKPLVSLINHFKSTFVQVAHNGLGLRYIFGDKIDAGGNSNMFKLFDEVKFIVHFVTMGNRGFESQFGLFDTEHRLKYHIQMEDKSKVIQGPSNPFHVEVRTATMGSIRMVDEMKFFKNGTPLDPSGDPSSWYSGEPGTGRWSDEYDHLMRARSGIERVTTTPTDLDGWKEFVE